ncbi:hypothetical protein KI387_031317, partial [Taxus chinensis]
GGIDIGEGVKPTGMDEVDDEVDMIGKGFDEGPTPDVEVGWNGFFMNVSRGINDIFTNGFLVVIDVGVDVEINVGTIDVGRISKGMDVIDDEGEE